MASGPNRDALFESGRDEQVEVNQRALIDKVLARYSGEFTVFRELLQNADDAGAKAVEIRFETKSYLDKTIPEGAKLPDLKRELIHQWTFKNNGTVFREEDWNRLKKIAEGNPDEQKIGAFGVGFYSLFSVTEEPFVVSGKEWMRFYWKDGKDQLFVRRGLLPAGSETPWTSFEMALREPAPLPGRPVDIARFLASSITFMTHISHVSMWFNNHKLVELDKDVDLARDQVLPKNMRTTSPQRMMTVKKVTSTSVKIDANVLRWVYTTGTERKQVPAPKPIIPQTNFFSSIFSSLTPSPSRTPEPPSLPPPEEADPLTVVQSSVTLSIYTANVDVSLDRKMSTELERATKKKPPAWCTYQLIYTGKDEYDASKKSDDRDFNKSTGSIFQGLRADLAGTGSAKVYIGHATGQSTGVGGHMAARFIPTVERESIDLVDRNVSLWNKELLYVGGFLCRAAYELEMATLKRLWNGASETSSAGGVLSGPDSELKSWLQARCLHALQFFTFYPSTPSPVVGIELEKAFFESSPSLSLISSAGVLLASQIRLANPTFAGFMKQIPTLPPTLATDAKQMIGILQSRGMIKPISFNDVLEELRSRALTEEEMVECLKVAVNGTPVTDPVIRGQFIDAAVFSLPDGKAGASERVVPLSTIKTFLNTRGTGSVIPVEGPFPLHTLPFSVSKNLVPEALVAFFGWSELTVVDWVSFLVSPEIESQGADYDLTRSAVFAERVLSVVAKGWPMMSKQHQTDVVNLLNIKQCVPTKSGLKLPGEAYFSNVDLFSDLPIVTMPKGTPVKGNLEKLLLALGVRKHVELQMVFDRMIRTGDWTIADLIRYLVSAKETLTAIEIDRLKQTPAFPKEGSNRTAPAVDPTGRIYRYTANELYEPSDALRDLGLPLLCWGERPRWKHGSEEAKFLFLLGLRRYPPIQEILALAASENVPIRTRALQYFLNNFTLHYNSYDANEFAELAFIPAVKPDGSTFLAKPNEVFVEPEAAVMGFSVVEQSLRNDAQVKLKVPMHPPTSALMPILEKSPPRDADKAQQIFGYLAARLGDFHSFQLSRLAQLSIIPVPSDEKQDQASPQADIRFAKPIEVYLLSTSSAQFHSKIFTFVDFGARANAFLRACGVKNEPTIDEIARMLITNPKRFWELSGGNDKFLAELKNLAANQGHISPSTRKEMTRNPVLLGNKQVPRSNEKEKADLNEEENDFEIECDLLRPDQIAIVDDATAFSLFGDRIYTAPQEDIFEQFYAALGSPRLSTLVYEEYRPSGGGDRDHKVGLETRRLILERLPLFLHQRVQRPRYSLDWFNNPNNFVVKVVGKLALHRTLNFGSTHVSKTQEASAAVVRDGRGQVSLLIGGNTALDLYEVSNSLCKLLFENHRVNDSLLFMTILSTDLRSLRRRGFNVDRILNQQKIEREQAEAYRKKMEQERQEAKLERERKNVAASNPPTAVPPGTFPAPEPAQAPKPLPQTSDKATSSAPPISTSPTPVQQKPDLPATPQTGIVAPTPRPADTKHARPTSALGRFNNFRNILRPQSAKSDTEQPLGTGTSRTGTRKPAPKGQVTPSDDLDKNVRMAIAACQGEKSPLLRNRQQMTMIQESLDEGYCDVTGHEGDFEIVGTVENTRVYVALDIPDRQMIKEQKHDVIVRFITRIVNPLLDVFKIPRNSVHLFYDLRGGLIAFNRNGSLFLNLRYYEAWHDAEVVAGHVRKAIISWYFTLAHEITHNLVLPHNAEFSFHFSVISQFHLMGLAQLVNS